MAVKARGDITLTRVDDGAKGDKGDTGDAGIGISSVVHYYALSDSSDTVPEAWTDPEETSVVPTPTKALPYLWGYDATTYTDGTITETTKHVIGVCGEDGNIEEFKDLAQSMVDDAKDDLQSQIKQESDSLNQTISDRNTALEKSMTAQLDSYKAEVGQYIEFGEDGLTLGASGSDFKTVIDNQRMAFKDGDTEVAYVSNKQLYIPDATIEKSLTLGNFKFTPHANEDGGMSLIWED